MNETAVTFLVDTIAPVVELLSPDSDSVSTADIDIFFSIADASVIQTLLLSIDEGPAVDVTNTRTYRIIDMDDGAHSLRFNAFDALGNSEAYVFEFEVSVPVIVTGRIVDSDGDPVAGANVTIGTVSTTTDADGQFTLTTVRGESTMTVSAEGMGEVTRSIDLSAQQSSISMGLISSSPSDDDTDITIITIAAVLVIVVLLAVGSFLLLRKKGKP
jgi:hypothetical protein